MHDWTYAALLGPTILLIVASWIVILPSMTITVSQYCGRTAKTRINLRIMKHLCRLGAFSTGALATLGSWRLGVAIDAGLAGTAPVETSDYIAPILMLVGSHLIATLARFHREEICLVRHVHRGHFMRSHAVRMIVFVLPLVVIGFASEGARGVDAGIRSLAQAGISAASKQGTFWTR